MDWNCSKCSFLNHSYRQTCLKCNNPNAGSPTHKNDWTCEKCNELNHSYRTQCRKCNHKPDNLVPNVKAVNDWICSNCKDVNFSFRDSCRKCSKHKSVTEETDQTPTNEITFATWNICNDKRAEKNKNTQWDDRCTKIIAMLNTNKYDVICLQELRNHDTANIKIKNFLNSLTKYDYCYTPYCEFSGSFYVAILYNPAKFIPIDYDQFHYNNCPENDKICFGVKLKIKNSNKAFWVYNTHFSMDSEEKNRSMNIITTKLGNITEPIIIAGDFNLFNDENGENLRLQAANYFTDMAYPLKDVSGTFVGFEHDEFKALDVTNMPRLDYIFCRNMKKIKEAEPVDFTNENIIKRDYPSDHLMITVKLEILDTNNVTYWS